MLGWWANDAHDSEDEQPSSLPKTTEDKRHTTTKALDHPKSRDSHGDVDRAENQLGLDGVVDTGGLEDCCTILYEVSMKRGICAGSTYVEKVVDTGPLLEELKRAAQERAVYKTGNARRLASEAFRPGTLTRLGLLGD